MSHTIIKKNPFTRAASYLLLTLFIPTLRPILNHHNTSELVIYISGFFISLFLIVYNNNKPYIKISDEYIFIYLLYKYKPEIHSINSIEEIQLLTPRKLKIFSRDFDPLEIYLRKKEINKFCMLLIKKGIVINRVYRNL